MMLTINHQSLASTYLLTNVNLYLPLYNLPCRYRIFTLLQPRKAAALNCRLRCRQLRCRLFPERRSVAPIKSWGQPSTLDTYWIVMQKTRVSRVLHGWSTLNRPELYLQDHSHYHGVPWSTCWFMFVKNGNGWLILNALKTSWVVVVRLLRMAVLRH